MKRIVLVFIFLVQFSGISYCAGLGIGFNGRNWQELTTLSLDKESIYTFKLGFIQGIYEGIFLSRDYPQWQLYSNKYTSDIGNAALLVALDTFYTNSENIDIPVVWAIGAIADTAKGKDQSAIQQTLNLMRKSAQELMSSAYAKPAETKQPEVSQETKPAENAQSLTSAPRSSETAVKPQDVKSTGFSGSASAVSSDKDGKVIIPLKDTLHKQIFDAQPQSYSLEMGMVQNEQGSYVPQVGVGFINSAPAKENNVFVMVEFLLGALPAYELTMKAEDVTMLDNQGNSWKGDLWFSFNNEKGGVWSGDKVVLSKNGATFTASTNSVAVPVSPQDPSVMGSLSDLERADQALRQGSEVPVPSVRGDVVGKDGVVEIIKMLFEVPKSKVDELKVQIDNSDFYKLVKKPSKLKTYEAVNTVKPKESDSVFASSKPAVEPKSQVKQSKAGESDVQKDFYVDPNGYFRIVAPQGWRIEQYLQDPRGKAAFYVPGGQADLRVLAKAVDISDYDGLMKDIKGIEKRLGVSMNIEPVVFNDMPAIKRQFSMPMQGKTLKILMVDILVNGISHNLQYSGPPAVFDKYYKTAWQSMTTYEPLKKDVSSSPQDVQKHEVAKWVRLTRIALDMNNKETAGQMLSAGLKVDPDNKELQQLKKELYGEVSGEKQPRSHYVDPKGYFKLIPPEGWQIEEYPDDPQGKVVFKGPDGAKIYFLAKDIEVDSSGKPVQKDKLTDEEIAANPNLEKITFAGYPAVKRSINLGESNTLMIDFEAGKAKHNLFYSAPPDKFSRYLPLAKEVFASYEVIDKKSSSEDVPVLLFMVLTVVGAIVLVNQKSIAGSTAAPGFARLTTPVIGFVMLMSGIMNLADKGHIFLMIFTILLAIFIFAAPLIAEEKRLKKSRQQKNQRKGRKL